MKHAGIDAFNRLEKLLRDLRALPDLRERSTGVFYRKSKPFLHFHEDSTELYADLRIADEFKRFPVNSADDKAVLLNAVRAVLTS
ncbi:hypothetical protein BWP39_29500 [Paraburkholderia acidicola]|uniref:Uncharacterized protein n=1 Tax=Paraburkholderia acidicola TaxID=1912599 RepID=A0A2A4ETU2_9BURK|nr:hypothetical protein [Paraburkholderia acidicola]PCE23818.1 hypothetical protein BWP39_29500 [Paraburkholderia acidicola]